MRRDAERTRAGDDIVGAGGDAEPGDGESNWLEGAQLIVVYLPPGVTVYTLG